MSRIRTSLSLSLPCMLAIGCSASSKSTAIKRFHSVLTPVIEVQADEAVYLNQLKPKTGGGSYSVGDPLPDFEKVLPATANGEVKFEIEGADFTMDAKMIGLPAANTVTDPLASSAANAQVMGDYWDIWLLSDVPNVVTIQMGKLVEDPATPGTFAFHFDSRTDVDFLGSKMTTNNVTSIVTAWPAQPLSLYDIRLIGMDIESLGGPEEPSGQHRMNDAAPFSHAIDWSKPDLDTTTP